MNQLFPVPEVTRVHTERGSHIEPHMADNASHGEHLAWHAAVVEVDAALPPGTIRIETADYRSNGIPVPDHFNVRYGRAVQGPKPYRAAWDFLNGISAGIRIAKEEAK